MKIKNKKILNILLLSIIPLIVALLVMTAVISGRNEKERYASAYSYNYVYDLINLDNGHYTNNYSVVEGSSVYVCQFRLLKNNLPLSNVSIICSISFDSLPSYTDTTIRFLNTNLDGHTSTLYSYVIGGGTGELTYSFTLYVPNQVVNTTDIDILSSTLPYGTNITLSLYCFSGDVTQSDYTMGYNIGYSDGYNDRFGGTALTPQTLFLEPVHQWLNMELFPGFTLAGAFEVVLFVALALIFIKMFSK